MPKSRSHYPFLGHELARAQELTAELNSDLVPINKKSKIKKEIKQIILLTQDSMELIKLRKDVIQHFTKYNDNFFQKNLGVLFLATVIGIAIFALIYLTSTRSISVDCSTTLPDFETIVIFPDYIANRDKEKIEVILTNKSNAIASVSLLVDFHGPAKHKIILPSKSNLLRFENIEPGEQKSEFLHIQLEEPIRIPSDPSRYINFSIRVNGNYNYCTPENLHIAATPITK